MGPHRLFGVGMAELGGCANMFTTPPSCWPGRHPYMLGALHIHTCTTGFIAGDGVNNPCSLAVDGAGDGKASPEELQY